MALRATSSTDSTSACATSARCRSSSSAGWRPALRLAFFVKRVTATPVLVAALIAQATVIVLFFATDLGFLWFNVIGCAIVVVLSIALELVRSLTRPSTAATWT